VLRGRSLGLSSSPLKPRPRKHGIHSCWTPRSWIQYCQQTQVSRQSGMSLTVSTARGSVLTISATISISAGFSFEGSSHALTVWKQKNAGHINPQLLDSSFMDSILPTDPSQPAVWYVIDRKHGVIDVFQEFRVVGSDNICNDIHLRRILL
jgi:hypothetical protein